MLSEPGYSHYAHRFPGIELCQLSKRSPIRNWRAWLTWRVNLPCLPPIQRELANRNLAAASVRRKEQRDSILKGVLTLSSQFLSP